jgi:hypothetical protein
MLTQRTEATENLGDPGPHEGVINSPKMLLKQYENGTKKEPMSSKLLLLERFKRSESGKYFY